MSRILIAGVGNIFLGDDGFGGEVARRLADEIWLADVTVADFGIRGIHLAYQIIDGYDSAIIVDAVSRGAAPGTVYVIEPDRKAAAPGTVSDSHDMVLDNVFAMVRTLAGELPPHLLIVGCEPADLSEKIGLSEPVTRAIPAAIRAVHEIVNGHLSNVRVQTLTLEEA
ncbi:MAG: hydrogenase maturation protease [Candidatus Binataceae bacterium]